MQDMRPKSQALDDDAVAPQLGPSIFNFTPVFSIIAKNALCRRTLFCGALSLVALPASAAITLKNVPFGGFASQGYIPSDTNDYFSKTSEGAFDSREDAMTASWTAGEGCVGAPVFGQRLGEYLHDTLALDWARAFLKTRVAMSTGQFQNHWRRLFMTGGGSAPKVVEAEADAVKLAAETPGAIAMADAAATGDLAIRAN